MSNVIETLSDVFALANNAAELAKTLIESTKDKNKKSDKDDVKIGSSGDSAQIGSSGNYAQIGSSGDSAKIDSSGDNAVISAIGLTVGDTISCDINARANLANATYLPSAAENRLCF